MSFSCRICPVYSLYPITQHPRSTSLERLIGVGGGVLEVRTDDRDLDQDILLENRDLREVEADGGTGSDTPDGGARAPEPQSSVLIVRGVCVKSRFKHCGRHERMNWTEYV